MKRLLLAVITFFLLLNVSAQTLTITSASPTVICGNGSTDTFSYKVSGTDIPANANIVIYQSTNPGFNPYLGQGDSIAGVKGDSIRQPNSCVKILGVFLDACTNNGANDEAQNEYMTITSGSGIKVSNLAIDFVGASNNQNPPLNNDINIGSNPCLYKTPDVTLISNLRANAPCNNTNIIPANLSDSIPPNAIILIFTSDVVTQNYNMSGLCSKGFPIYVLQNACKRNRGAFSNMNNPDCSAVDSIRYRVTAVINKATGCSDTIIYDRCGTLGNGTYAVNLPNQSISTIANGGIKNNTSNNCNGIDYIGDGLDYTQIVKSSDTTFKFSISPSFCNTGFHYIKAIINPGTPQVTSNTIQYKLVCLDLTATPTTTIICSGQNAVINNSSTDANATFSWTVSGGANITGEAAGNGNQINQTLINTSAVKDSIVYSITATDDICTVNKTVKIVVNPLLPKPNLGRDTAVCGVVNIPLSTGNTNTTWFRNDIQVALNQGNITANDSGIYRAVIIGSCNTASDTIIISKVNTQPKPNLGRDTAVCGVVNIPLSTGNINTTWFRNNIQIALNQSNITANDSGTYRAVVTGTCGTASDTIIISKVNTQPKPNLGRDTAICGVINIPLNTGNTNTTWFRNDIQIALNQGTITANSSGTYRAVITGSCGTASDTIIITQSPNINFDFGTDNTFVCNGSSITLDASNAYDTYVWSTGSAARFITVTTPDIYWVDVFKNGCKGTDTITVNLIDVPLKPFIGNDTTYCGTFSRVLTVGTDVANWTRNNIAISTSSSITVTQGGRYIASITNSCGSVFDTIDINTANALVINLGRDTVLCAGQTKVLNAFVAGSSITYTWNTGAATPSITVPARFFRYIVEVSNGICTVSDSIIIDSTGAPNKPFLGNDTAFCGDFSKVLITGDNTFWSTGETGIQITVTSPDQYIAENRNVCGSAKDTIVITQFVAPIVNLGKDTTICDSIILTVGNAGFNSIFWSTGDSANSILVTNKGLYTVTVTNTNCSKTDSIDIDKDCDYDVYLPSAFSPNNDNFNDVLVPLSDVSGIIVTDFIIFNRWSEKVFESRNFSPNDKAFGWKGTYKGEPAAVDQYGYYYAVRLQDGKIKTYKGTVTIIK